MSQNRQILLEVKNLKTFFDTEQGVVKGLWQKHYCPLYHELSAGTGWPHCWR